jgi:hypothetical protein
VPASPSAAAAGAAGADAEAATGMCCPSSSLEPHFDSASDSTSDTLTGDSSAIRDGPGSGAAVSESSASSTSPTTAGAGASVSAVIDGTE